VFRKKVPGVGSGNRKSSAAESPISRHYRSTLLGVRIADDGDVKAWWVGAPGRLAPRSAGNNCRPTHTIDLGQRSLSPDVVRETRPKFERSCDDDSYVPLLISARTFRAPDAGWWRRRRGDDGGGRGLGLQHCNREQQLSRSLRRFKVF